MTTITLQEKFTDVLASFGDLQEAVNTAVQRYTIDQVTTRINELRRRDDEYNKKYGMDYSVFAKRSGEDDEFVKDVETKISKTWEADLADWEFCHEGIEDWTKKLQDILLK
jgi:predicted RecB family endonuclease